MKQLLYLLAFFVIAALPLACGDTTRNAEVAEEAEPEYIDAVVAASEHYRLLSQDGHVRVIEMHLPAGTRDNLHSHSHETVYFIKGGKAKIHVGDEVVDAEIPDGHVMHHEPWTHSIENTGETDIRAIIFERMELVPVESKDEYLDAAEVASEHYTLLSQEGKVRVLKMTLPPGERDNRHSHYREAVYFLSGGKAKIYVGDEVIDAEIPDGHVMHHEPWTHSVENAGETTINAIIFEEMPSAE